MGRLPKHQALADSGLSQGEMPQCTGLKERSGQRSGTWQAPGAWAIRCPTFTRYPGQMYQTPLRAQTHAAERRPIAWGDGGSASSR